MRLASEVLLILFVLAFVLFVESPGTVLMVVFLAALWAGWRRRPRRMGVRR
ncbi:hypothetical protein [Nocardia terpenica]|uniref:hypothetical protein n=1 Tax=Nocardia terpenica TaxID=455432 RepID=UPI0002E42EB2|nr:hypothetical protein [Nocardia terpenica]NQE87544.1 hypothetical protein [Nocardia terpenica]